MNTFIKISTSLIVGAGIGAAITYLKTPRTGAQSRKQVLDKYDATKKALEEAATSKLEEAKSLLDATAKKSQMAKNVANKVKNALVN